MNPLFRIPIRLQLLLIAAIVAFTQVISDTNVGHFLTHTGRVAAAAREGRGGGRQNEIYAISMASSEGTSISSIFILSLPKAFASIWRIRSRVTPKLRPMVSRV